MTRLFFAALLALSVPVALHAKEPPSSAKKASPGKPRAPVRVDGTLGAGSAHLKLTFEAAADRVDVKVYGVDGLEVTSAELAVRDGSFAKGEAKELDVSFTAPSGERSHLAISISGEFSGVPRTTVRSFTVGEPSETRRRASKEKVKTTPEGERLKVMPSR
jgi:hypothetical protein